MKRKRAIVVSKRLCNKGYDFVLKGEKSRIYSYYMGYNLFHFFILSTYGSNPSQYLPSDVFCMFATIIKAQS